MKHLKYYLLLLVLCLGLYGCGTPAETVTPTPEPTATSMPMPEPTATKAPQETLTPTPEPTATSTPTPVPTQSVDVTEDFAVVEITLEDIPEYTSEPYVVVNGNVPFFTVSSDMTESFEVYTDLDALGRCGVAYANIGKDLMPTEDRGSIGSVKPSGWQTAKYEIVDGNYLYNRCHLIGFQLTGENANRKNLITGTRYMNVIGMLPFENMVDDYIDETGNHVMYRVLPMFDGDNLVADGVLMEAWSVEDDGEGICFNVFVYNIQPGIAIDYATGNSALSEDADDLFQTAPEVTYILNTNTMKFHKTTCGSAATITESNRKETSESRDELISQGYKPCGSCDP